MAISKEEKEALKIQVKVKKRLKSTGMRGLLETPCCRLNTGDKDVK